MTNSEPPTKRSKHEMETRTPDKLEEDTSSKTIFIKKGNIFKPTAKANLDIHKNLPVGTYNVVVTDAGYALGKIDDFEITGKIYGDLTEQSDRIMTTFMRRTASTGVLLAGEKGSGKTLLTKYLAIQAAKVDIPTIVINSKLSGEAFNTFLQLIEQPVIIVFDEYEKVYNGYGDQDKLLTLLDGVYASKKLFLLTSNSRWGVNSHMLNRPGRLFYVMHFYGLNLAFVKGYAEDNLVDKSHVEKVCVVAAVFDAFNLDMLKALIEEMNRYNESPGQALKYLNVCPEFSSSAEYALTWTNPEGTIMPLVDESKEWTGNPITKAIVLSHEETKLKVTAEHFTKLDTANKSFTFFKDGHTLVVTPIKKAKFDWEQLGVANSDNAINSMVTDDSE